MPYDKTNYPTSFKNLKSEIKEKAIEIVNALMDDKEMEESIAIPTAISQAKDWAENHGITVTEGDNDNKEHGKDQYVIPHEKGWALKTEGNEQVSFTFSKKEDAISKGKKMARKNKGNLIIQKSKGEIQEKFSYNN